MPTGFASRPVCWIHAFRLVSRAARREVGFEASVKLFQRQPHTAGDLAQV
jgi:hypothetical protein